MNERSSIMIPILTLVGLLLGLGLIAYPSYRRAWTINREIQGLTERVESLESDNMEIERLQQELSARRDIVDTEFKAIPRSPDVAGLIRHISLPVDGRRVVDQTISAAQQAKAIETLPDAPFRVLPVTIDMTADFDSIFATLQSIESLDRLVRTMTVRMSRDDKFEGQLMSSIAIEVVFESNVVAEVR